MYGRISPGQVSNRPSRRSISNSGDTSDTCGNIAISSEMPTSRPLAREVEPGDRVRGHRAEHHRDQRGDQRDADRVDQRPDELVGLEDRAVVVQRPLARDEVAVGERRRRLERQRRDPQHRDQREDDHDEVEHDPSAPWPRSCCRARPSAPPLLVAARRGGAEQLHEDERDDRDRDEDQHRHRRADAEVEARGSGCCRPASTPTTSRWRRRSARRCCRRPGTRPGCGTAARPGSPASSPAASPW